jgi:hypothetical protein
MTAPIEFLQQFAPIRRTARGNSCDASTLGSPVIQLPSPLVSLPACRCQTARDGGASTRCARAAMTVLSRMNLTHRRRQLAKLKHDSSNLRPATILLGASFATTKGEMNIEACPICGAGGLPPDPILEPGATSGYLTSRFSLYLGCGPRALAPRSQYILGVEPGSDLSL